MKELYVVVRGTSGEGWILDDPVIEVNKDGINAFENKEDAITLLHDIFAEWADPKCEVEWDETEDKLPYVEITSDEEDYHCFMKVSKILVK